MDDAEKNDCEKLALKFLSIHFPGGEYEKGPLIYVHSDDDDDDELVATETEDILKEDLQDVDIINATEEASPDAADDSWYFTDNDHQQRGKDPQQHQNTGLHTLGMVTIAMSDDDTEDFNDEQNDDSESTSVHGAGGAAGEAADGAAGESAVEEAVEAVTVESDVGTAGAAGEAQSGPPLPGPAGRAVIDLTGDDKEEAEPVPRRAAQHSKKRRL